MRLPARIAAALAAVSRHWRRPALACLAVASLAAAALMADVCLAIALSRSAGLAAYLALGFYTLLGILFSSVGSYSAYSAVNGLFAPHEDEYS